MVHEHKIKESFRRAKEDVEGVKDEVAFLVKRIAKIEELLNKRTIEEMRKKKK